MPSTIVDVDVVYRYPYVCQGLDTDNISIFGIMGPDQGGTSMVFLFRSQVLWADGNDGSAMPLFERGSREFLFGPVSQGVLWIFGAKNASLGFGLKRGRD